MEAKCLSLSCREPSEGRSQALGRLGILDDLRWRRCLVRQCLPIRRLAAAGLVVSPAQPINGASGNQAFQ